MTAAAMTVLRWAAPSPKGGDDDLGDDGGAPALKGGDDDWHDHDGAPGCTKDRRGDDEGAPRRTEERCDGPVTAR